MQRFKPEQALCETRREFGEHGGVTPSISRSATFTVMDPATMPEIFGGRRGPESGGCFLYSRHFNPTSSILGRYLAAMENTEAAICTASGMAAISSTLLQLCHRGDHIVSSDTIYGGSHALFNDLMPQMGIDTTFVDPSDLEAVSRAITPQTRVLYTEAMANPTLKMAHIPKLADLAHRRGIKLVVDNTFTPMMISPAVLGADIVVYSLTKFINGASDVIAGAICADKAFIHQLMDLHTGRVMLLGPTMDPRVAYDIIQRLPHLAIRMREHSRRAHRIASRLEELGVPVIYPGLAAHPQHALVTELINEGYGYGGLMAIDCGTQRLADAFMDRLQNEEDFGYIAVSLGYYDTLMSCSSATTSSEISDDAQKMMGLSEGLVRLSVGFTGSLAERLAQMERAVIAVGLHRS
ncbi:MAG: aminotransferase class I/II-fold pyridoxal phosphate-dependent enzyme [Desulfosarcinaceae bacterium]|nr:aminotransferase class I/II-fold pyridoxal phosphate-dependent enzyme [Desulfosarcinaceae bacterium]